MKANIKIPEGYKRIPDSKRKVCDKWLCIEDIQLCHFSWQKVTGSCIGSCSLPSNIVIRKIK